MTQENTVQVEYIGAKTIKTDNVTGSGVVWNGCGDIQPVTLTQWSAMSRHTGVWRLALTGESKFDGDAADASKAGEATLALGLGDATQVGAESHAKKAAHKAHAKKAAE